MRRTESVTQSSNRKEKYHLTHRAESCALSPGIHRLHEQCNTFVTLRDDAVDATDGITSVVPAVFRSAVGKVDSSHCLLIVTTAGTARSFPEERSSFCRPGLRGFPRSGPFDGGRSPRHGAVVRGQTQKFLRLRQKVLWLVHLSPGRLKRVWSCMYPRKVRLRRTGRSAAQTGRDSCAIRRSGLTHRKV